MRWNFTNINFVININRLFNVTSILCEGKSSECESSDRYAVSKRGDRQVSAVGTSETTTYLFGQGHITSSKLLNRSRGH